MSYDLTAPDFVHPAYVNMPPRHHSRLEQVETVCGWLGETVEPEQAYAIDVLTGVKADHSPANRTGVVICARQNLKTYDLERIVLNDALNPYNGVELIMWTSQQLDTTEETFEHFVSWFENDDDYPEFANRLIKVTRGRGSYQIALLAGELDDRPVRKRIKFKARSGKAGRGLTGDEVVFDEAFAVERAHLGALIPTLTTRRRARVLYGSSACHDYSDVLADLVEKGRRGGPRAPAYIEWCAPGSLRKPGCASPDCRHIANYDQGCALDKRELIILANPMVGRRIEWKTLEDERDDLPADEYARERMGWHDELQRAEAPPITAEMWRGRYDVDSYIPEGESVVLSAEIALDRRSASIAVAGMRDELTMHLELIEQDYGTEWVLQRLLDLRDSLQLATVERIDRNGNTRECEGIVVDPVAPGAVDLIVALRREGIEPIIMSASEAAAACGGLLDAIHRQEFTHSEKSTDKHLGTVAAAIDGAVRRNIGDGGWAFGRKKSADEAIDVTPASAITAARWGLTMKTGDYDVGESIQ